MMQPRQPRVTFEPICAPDEPELCEECWHTGLVRMPMVAIGPYEMMYVDYRFCIECGYRNVV